MGSGGGWEVSIGVDDPLISAWSAVSSSASSAMEQISNSANFFAKSHHDTCTLYTVGHNLFLGHFPALYSFIQSKVQKLSRVDLLSALYM